MGNPTDSPGDEPAPPSYSEATSPQVSINITDNTTNINSNNAATVTKTKMIGNTTPAPDKITSPLTEHLSTLGQRMREAKAGQWSQQGYNDSIMVSLMIPHIETFLHSLPDIQPHPSRAELTLVPSGAVHPGWELTHTGDIRPGEVIQVARVGIIVKLPTIRPELWFIDESMAKRLAAHLQPARKIPYNTRERPAPPYLLPVKTSTQIKQVFGVELKELPEISITQIKADPKKEEEHKKEIARMGGWSSMFLKMVKAKKEKEKKDKNVNTSPPEAPHTTVVIPAPFSNPSNTSLTTDRTEEGTNPNPSEESSTNPTTENITNNGSKDGPSVSQGEENGGGCEKGVHERVLFAPVNLGTTTTGHSTTTGTSVGEGLQAVSMVVRPQVVTFRRENEFGIWESMNGFAIVVAVRFR